MASLRAPLLSTTLLALLALGCTDFDQFVIGPDDARDGGGKHHGAGGDLDAAADDHEGGMMIAGSDGGPRMGSAHDEDSPGEDGGPDAGAPVCGNHVTEAGEQCDDGNDTDGDGCDDCAFSCSKDIECEDGLPCNGGERCSEHRCVAGTPEDGAACTPEAGGNGMCALGLCVPEGCGDGSRQPPEECDDGGESANCNADCTFASCGDGKVNGSAQEQCDDRDSTPGDGCEANCRYSCEQNAQCADSDPCNGDESCNQDHFCSPGTPITSGQCAPGCTGGSCAVCPNGTREDGELCDGNDLDGMTCSQIVGFTGGTLHCNASCDGYDTSSCTAPTGGAPGDACTKDDQCDWECFNQTCSAVVEVAGGNNHSCVLFNSGHVACWGMQSNGRLGNGLTTSATVTTPQLVHDEGGGALSDVKQLSVGVHHTCVTLNSGAAKCWGAGGVGRLGTGDESDRAVATSMKLAGAPVTGAVEVAAGSIHSCYRDGSAVRCAGRDNIGQLGDNTTPASSQSLTFRTVVSTSGTGMLAGITSLSSAGNHTCGLAGASGKLFCWGYNNSSQLGTTTNPSFSDIPLEVTGLGTIKRLALEGSGGSATCVQLSNDTVKCWGQNLDSGGGGKLGVGSSTAIVTTPALVTTGATPLAGIRDTALGGEAHCYLVGDNLVYCAGRNLYGQLGPVLTGNTVNATQLLDASNGNPFETLGVISGIASGWSHLCAWNNRRILCWGYNSDGQTGVAGADQKLPVEVHGPVAP